MIAAGERRCAAAEAKKVRYQGPACSSPRRGVRRPAIRPLTAPGTRLYVVVHGQGEPQPGRGLLVIDGVPITATDKLISLGDASDANVAALKAALVAGNIDSQACSADGAGFCAATMDDLGNQI